MTLTQASYWTRRLGVLAIGAIAFFIVVAFIILRFFQEEVAPPEYLQANYACTDFASDFQAQQLTIPTLETASGSENVFRINTETGRLEALPRIVNVYKYNNPVQSLNSQNEAKKLAEKLGFDPNTIVRRGAVEFLFEDKQYARRLIVQAKNLNFQMITDINSPNALPESKSLPNDSEARQIAKSFLQSFGILKDFALEQPTVKNIKVQPDGSFTEAPSRNEADLIRVDFFRSKSFVTINSQFEGAQEARDRLNRQYQDFSEAEVQPVNTSDGRYELFTFDTVVVNDDPEKSNVSVYVGPVDDRRDADRSTESIYLVDYAGWQVEELPCGTYELIPSTQVTSLIEEGKGSLVYLVEKNGDTVKDYSPLQVSQFTILNVTLGYYDSFLEQQFMQPIYIVRGEAQLANGTLADFIYYLPAINYEIIQDKKVEEVVPESENSQETTL